MYAQEKNQTKSLLNAGICVQLHRSQILKNGINACYDYYPIKLKLLFYSLAINLFKKNQENYLYF